MTAAAILGTRLIDYASSLVWGRVHVAEVQVLGSLVPIPRLVAEDGAVAQRGSASMEDVGGVQAQQGRVEL